MNCRLDVGCVKEEVGEDYSVCKKEDPDVLFEPTSREQLNRFIESKSVGDVSSDKKYETDIHYKDESSSESSLETKFRVKDEYDSKDFKIKQEQSDNCSYFIDSTDLGSLSETHLIGVRNVHDKVEPFIGLDDLLQEPESQLFFCAHCDFSTKFICSLSRHITRKHRPSNCRWKYFCDVCSYKCLQPSDLKRHSALHDGRYLYKCYFCDYGSNKKGRLFQHIVVSNHNSDSSDSLTNSMKCYFCSFKSKLKSDFLTHLIDNHKQKFAVGPKEINYYRCQLCSYVTTARSTLIVHIDGVHKKIRPYTCNLCDYAANRFSDLRIHVNAKHEKITPFKCETCAYASAYKKHLRRHILSQHVNKKPVKKYKVRTKRRQTKRIKTEVINSDMEIIL